MVKRSVSITVDCEVWEEAGSKLDSRSEFCENQLRLFLELNNDEEDQLLEQIQSKREEIYVLEDKLCAFRKDRLSKAKKKPVFDDAMVTVNRINNRLGKIGKNQIRKIAKSNQVPFDLLLENCRVTDGINIVNFAEVPRK
ncbi:hypothetical protein [Methanobrevibacter sp.]|jgi:uncharacterized metal-binding protein|uniref:hypothetical protein n=1 Tax=Methanobrevibacter sp. TaxID=66852 RepID=UPI00386FA699